MLQRLFKQACRQIVYVRIREPSRHRTPLRHNRSLIISEMFINVWYRIFKIAISFRISACLYALRIAAPNVGFHIYWPYLYSNENNEATKCSLSKGAHIRGWQVANFHSWPIKRDGAIKMHKPPQQAFQLNGNVAWH